MFNTPFHLISAIFQGSILSVYFTYQDERHQEVIRLFCLYLSWIEKVNEPYINFELNYIMISHGCSEHLLQTKKLFSVVVIFIIIR